MNYLETLLQSKVGTSLTEGTEYQGVVEDFSIAPNEEGNVILLVLTLNIEGENHKVRLQDNLTTGSFWIQNTLGMIASVNQLESKNVLEFLQYLKKKAPKIKVYPVKNGNYLNIRFAEPKVKEEEGEVTDH